MRPQHECLPHRAEDDGPGGREREGALTAQSVRENHPGGGDREGREHSEQVMVVIH